MKLKAQIDFIKLPNMEIIKCFTVQPAFVYNLCIKY